MAETIKLDTFTEAYVKCALWASSAEIGNCDECSDVVLPNEHERCPTCGGKVYATDLSFMDRNYDRSDIDPKSLAKMADDCLTFQEANGELLAVWYAECGESEDRAGHDFWLTRNGHGAGFWDRWASGTKQGKVGQALTAACKAYGTCDLYLGDDGKVHVFPCS